MTNIIIYRTEEYVKGVEVSGHSGYADAGEDIVCAGISVLTLNLINSLEELSEDAFSVREDEETGYIKIWMSYEEDEEPDYESHILFDSYLIGIKNLLEDYKEFISLEIKEV